MDFVRNEVQLGRLEKDGQPLRAHLQAHERAKRKPLERLHRKPPAAGRYLLPIFSELVAGRCRSNPLTLRDLADWVQVTGLHLTPWERKTLLELSAVLNSES